MGPGLFVRRVGLQYSLRSYQLLLLMFIWEYMWGKKIKKKKDQTWFSCINIYGAPSGVLKSERVKQGFWHLMGPKICQCSSKACFVANIRVICWKHSDKKAFWKFEFLYYLLKCTSNTQSMKNLLLLKTPGPEQNFLTSLNYVHTCMLLLLTPVLWWPRTVHED